MVVHETRISEAKVTIRELFGGITRLDPRVSICSQEVRRGFRLASLASYLNAKTWTQRIYDRSVRLAMYVRLGRRISDVAVNYCPIQR